MADLLVVDTDILIDAGRKDPTALARLHLEEQRYELSVSTVTYLELLVGCRDKREQRDLERFLRGFQLIPIDTAVSAEAVGLVKRYRLSHGLLIADALIAATALQLQAPLLTKNQRDFRFIARLILPAYP